MYTYEIKRDGACVVYDLSVDDHFHVTKIQAGVFADELAAMMVYPELEQTTGYDADKFMELNFR
jgi:hypothetical protein